MVTVLRSVGANFLKNPLSFPVFAQPHTSKVALSAFSRAGVSAVSDFQFPSKNTIIGYVQRDLLAKGRYSACKYPSDRKVIEAAAKLLAEKNLDERGIELGVLSSLCIKETLKLPEKEL